MQSARDGPRTPSRLPEIIWLASEASGEYTHQSTYSSSLIILHLLLHPLRPLRLLLLPLGVRLRPLLLRLGLLLPSLRLVQLLRPPVLGGAIVEDRQALLAQPVSLEEGAVGGLRLSRLDQPLVEGEVLQIVPHIAVFVLHVDLCGLPRGADALSGLHRVEDLALLAHVLELVEPGARIVGHIVAVVVDVDVDVDVTVAVTMSAAVVAVVAAAVVVEVALVAAATAATAIAAAVDAGRCLLCNRRRK